MHFVIELDSLILFLCYFFVLHKVVMLIIHVFHFELFSDALSFLAKQLSLSLAALWSI